MGQALRDAAKAGDAQTIRALLDAGVPVDHCGAPEARNPKLQTQNPKPETSNPQPETRSPKPEARNPEF